MKKTMLVAKILVLMLIFSLNLLGFFEIILPQNILYKINNKCAYASDVSKFHIKDLKYLKNLKYLVIDCLRFTPHPSHYNLEQALNLIEKLKPKKAILTNMHSDLDYNYLLKILPKNVKPAYDGLSFNI